MTDFKYDPEYPFMVQGHGIGKPGSKFTHRSDAEAYARLYSNSRVIDTTPKPKIPGDAEFITWIDHGERRMAGRDSLVSDWEVGDGILYSTGALIHMIGDAEITVLDPREEN